ncbi:MAG: hypothetical protein L6R40_005079 [Gallowayella cf. fulva]|nr:MAG: hypothetical protein L6R40_005079 [Xanthomendoza cf. fulva]
MHFHIRNTLSVAYLTATVAASLGGGSGVEERAVCNADNVLRALQAPQNSASASQFCYSLILQGVPTTTLVTAGVTPPPVIVTTTSTISRTVYPNGLTLEQLPYPTFVSQYPAPRVSSGCSCLLGPKPTSTRTATNPTDVQPPPQRPYNMIELIFCFPADLDRYNYLHRDPFRLMRNSHRISWRVRLCAKLRQPGCHYKFHWAQ